MMWVITCKIHADDFRQKWPRRSGSVNVRIRRDFFPGRWSCDSGGLAVPYGIIRGVNPNGINREADLSSLRTIPSDGSYRTEEAGRQNPFECRTVWAEPSKGTFAVLGPNETNASEPQRFNPLHNRITFLVK